MEALCKHLSKIRVPCDNQAIYKDECVYSYDNPESPTGLYVSLTSFLGFGEEYVQKYAEKTGNCVFLHIYREKHLKEDAAKGEDEAGPERKITRLAIGVEGGYNDKDTKNYEYKDNYSIVVMPDIQNKLPFPNNDFPLIVTQSVESILAQESAISKLEKQTLTGTWDGEVRQVSKFSENLQQLNNGKKIPPSGWKCEKCDLTNNLWLNLTDGSILCGRKFFDGSGGNDHAVEHYREFSYPLAVKLGTITADGKSDVFSYPEDDMVIDSKLEDHLAHFGINMAAMKKSEKSMVELELEINQRIGEWSLLTESESELQPMSGPGYTGMRNLGNSCYINSVMQVLFTLPDFISRFVGKGAEVYFNEFPADPANDFNIQMSKLGNGLWSGKYSSITENSLDTTGISPVMFKNIIGKNHPDFGTKQQQDAYDFYLHLINLLERNSRNQPNNPVDALTFSIEDRVECMASKKVKYTSRQEFCLPLVIPLEKATNLDEVKEYLEKKANCPAGAKNDKDVVRHKVPLQACLERFFAAEVIDQFYSSAIKGTTTAKKTARLVNMPDYLMMHLRKFTLGDDWVPKKLDVEVKMPDELDLSNWRASGKQPHEEELPETDTAPKFVFDENMVSSLMQMGFPQEACKRAVFHTKNGGLDIASNWLMEHIGDADFSDPFVIPNETASTESAAAFVPDADSLFMLMSMGFDERQATKALKATDGNVERAADWIFSHADDMDVTESAPVGTESNSSSSSSQRKKNARDGSGKYKLVAFISHMGTSAQVGHYVCHIKKDGQWVIFNDSKVALSQNPPKDLGYLYLYKREE
ncbi:ubiquitin carboxyl-terminal hydrolase 5 [Lucilia cuprina]|uniref:ubiquitin carboxyl-terminal hydrolase 5 n=1 Tax=Lucilia cuprina TaxID=7375 RepID=UPI001F05DE59|nr:ubiquitin carboxyl-terminal hydrolase 5 [Lucilia cuprina]